MRADAQRTAGAAVTVACVVVVCLLTVAPVTLVAGRGVDACGADAEDAARVAVREAFSDEVEVLLSDISCERVQGERAVEQAVAEPGSRTAGPVRFVLHGRRGTARVRLGRLTAVVQVRAPHARARVALASGTVLDASLVTTVTDLVGRVPFGTLVAQREIVGARVKRPVALGAVLTTTVIERPALVRSGADVVTVARVSGVEVRGRAVAAQSGGLGDVVLVINPDSRKRLRGRVIEEGTVEVMHVS